MIVFIYLKLLEFRDKLPKEVSAQFQALSEECRFIERSSLQASVDAVDIAS